MSMYDRTKHLLLSGRMPHAAILEGNGAPALAEFIAQSAVCEGRNAPCGECPHCIRAKSGNHPDIINCRGTGVTGALSVSQVREIKLDAYVLPSEAKKKVYILQNAEKMLAPAQNALLKLLEEPPQSVLMLLVCSEKKGLLETVQSRAALISANDELESTETPAIITADNIAKSLLQSDELPILKETVPLLQDKKLFLETVEQLGILFREVYRAKSGASVSNNTAREIADKITLQMALSLCDAVDEIRTATSRNANQKLNVTRLCARLRQAVCK